MHLRIIPIDNYEENYTMAWQLLTPTATVSTNFSPRKVKNTYVIPPDTQPINNPKTDNQNNKHST